MNTPNKTLRQIREERRENMTAKNGFNKWAAAITADGRIVTTSPHTWHDQKEETVSGIVAGVVGEMYGDECIWPTEDITSAYLMEKFLDLAERIKAVPCPFVKNVSSEAKALYDSLRQF